MIDDHRWIDAFFFSPRQVDTPGRACGLRVGGGPEHGARRHEEALPEQRRDDPDPHAEHADIMQVFKGPEH